MRPSVIDAHCHAGAGDGLTGPWDTAAPLNKYLRRARSAGITRTVIFAPFHSDYAVANAAVARIVLADPRRFVGFAFVHCKRDAGRIGQMVGHAVRRWGFRGIKVHRLDAPATREVCEVARCWRLPVLYDVVGEPYRVELLAQEYPDVRFIVPHLGSFADDWRAHVQVIDQISRFPNVYTDTAGVRRFDYLVEAVRRAGPGKVIFGSDGPWLHPGQELHKIRLLGLRPEARAQIEGATIQRLMAEVRREPAAAVPLGRPRPAAVSAGPARVSPRTAAVSAGPARVPPRPAAPSPRSAAVSPRASPARGALAAEVWSPREGRHPPAVWPPQNASQLPAAARGAAALALRPPPPVQSHGSGH